MGLFKFVKDAGASIFGGAAAGSDFKPVQTHLTENGIDPSGLKFRFEGASLTVTGSLPSQEEKEKAVMILGNVRGVEEVHDRIIVGSPAPIDTPEAEAPAATQAEAPAASSTPGGEPTPEDWSSDTYTVQAGDSLSGISKKVYGSASKYMRIFEANTPMLKDPNLIYPGQVLRIPPEA